MKRKELISQIRFQLDQLSSRNEHMIFEHLTRHFARARIHKNFIPATGPVQAGGDQGRDFETFHSYISQTNISSSVFIGDFSTTPIVGACSLQKEPIKSGKIVGDITTILGSGTNVERIYFFSSEDIPVGHRHKLIDQVKQDFNVELEILDGQALSEQLVDKDLFWIAHEFLNIPIEYYPKEEFHGEYSSLRSDYEDYIITTYSTETFVDIVNALRYIYKDPDLVNDVPFWLKHLEYFIKSDDVRKTQRNALYEKAIVNIISKNDVSDLKQIFDNYFSDYQDYVSAKEIEKAINLLSLSFSTKKMLGHDIADESMKAVRSSLLEIVDEQIKLEKGNPNLVASYISLKANAALNLSHDLNSFEDSIANYITVIEELIKILPEASMFPITRLSSFLNKQIEILLKLDIGTENIESIVTQVEKFSADKEGEFHDAESKRNRAISYLKYDKPHKAIKTLHQVKNKWFNQETIKGSILSAMLISQTYQKLNLNFAAKYYAMAGGHLIFKGEDDGLLKYLPEVLNTISSIDYALGNWINFIEVLDLAIPTFHTIKKDFDIYEKESSFSILYHISIAKYINDRFQIGLDHYINHKLDSWGYLKDEIIELESKAKESFDKIEELELIKTLHTQLVNPPFNDLGEHNSINFNMFGLEFRIEFENSYHTVAIAEQFSAIIQILLADLIEVDLHNLQIPVLIKLESNADEPNFKQLPSHENSIWHVSFPLSQTQKSEEIYKAQFNYIEFILALLADISLLNNEKLFNMLEVKFKDEGLTSKTTFVNSYEHLFRQFYSEEAFNSSYRNHFTCNNLDYNFSSSANEYYIWNSDISPHYNEEKIIKDIDNRIEHLSPVNVTFPKLKKNEDFIIAIDKLRTEGHLDWQIYMAIVNNAVNYKINRIAQPKTPEEIFHFFKKHMNKKEDEWYVELPLELFSYEKLKMNLNTMILSTVLPSYGLQQR